MVGDPVDTKKNSKRPEANDVISRVMKNQAELHPDGFKEKEGPLHRQGCGVTLFFLLILLTLPIINRRMHCFGRKELMGF